MPSAFQTSSHKLQPSLQVKLSIDEIKRIATEFKDSTVDLFVPILISHLNNTRSWPIIRGLVRRKFRSHILA